MGILPRGSYNVVLLILFLLLVVLGGLLVRRLLARRKKKVSLYQRSEGLFSPDERSFLSVLDQALGKGYRVFGQVPPGVLLRPKKGLRERDRQKALSVLEGLRLEFVVCRRRDLAVVGVVGWEGGSKKERVSKASLDEALREVGIPAVRFRSRSNFAVEELRTALARKIPPSAAENRPRSEDGWELGALDAAASAGDWRLGQAGSARPAVAAKSSAVPAAESVPSPRCPHCGGEMQQRRATRGPHAGTLFWICSQFPRCRKVIPVKTKTRTQAGC